MNLTLQTIPSPLISELLANSKLDGVVLDTEHGCFNNESLYSCIQVITLLNKQCYVRFTHLDKSLVRMCLDAGVDGVIFSTVETYEQGKDLISYCKYPASGGVRGQGLVRENKWKSKNIYNREPVIVAQIETKISVDNIDRLLQCGFDKFIIGPYDLSASLGCTADWSNLEYVKYIGILYNKIPLHKLGCFLPTISDINNFVNKRPSLVVWGMDTDFIIQGINNIKLL